MYWDSLGNWVNAKVGGTFMIRPEFTTPPGIVSHVIDQTPSIVINSFPNPLKGNRFTTTTTALVSDYFIQLISSNGQEVWRAKKPYLGIGQHTWEIPKLPTGIYFLRHAFFEPSETFRVVHEKLLIAQQ